MNLKIARMAAVFLALSIGLASISEAGGGCGSRGGPGYRKANGKCASWR